MSALDKPPPPWLRTSFMDGPYFADIFMLQMMQKICKFDLKNFLLQTKHHPQGRAFLPIGIQLLWFRRCVSHLYKSSHRRRSHRCIDTHIFHRPQHILHSCGNLDYIRQFLDKKKRYVVNTNRTRSITLWPTTDPCTGVARNFDWVWGQNGKIRDVFRWRNGDNKTDFLKFDFIINSLKKKHNFATSRNFRSPNI